MGHNILLISLPNENLETIAKETAKTYKVDTDFQECDLTLINTAEEIYSWTQQKGYNVNFLINNAGFGGVGPFESYSFAYVNRMLDLNVRATTHLTHFFIPELKKNAPSYLLNNASMVANFPFPYKTMYAATKVYVKSFTLALREELKPYNVKVSLLQPGATPTNDIVKTQIDTGGFFARLSVTSVETVVNKAIEGTLKGQAVIIPGFKNRLSLRAIKLFPRPILQRLLAKQGSSMQDH